MSTASATLTLRSEEEKTLQEELALPILLADRVIKSAQEAESSKQDCSDISKQVDRLSQLLRSSVRLYASTPSLYDRPLRRISSDITKNLDRALTLVRKCKHTGVLRQVFSITSVTDFRKVSNLLESSIADMKWLLSIFECTGSASLSLPPIANDDPILAWVWSYISTIQMGQIKDRVDAANGLASLANDSDRNRKLIVEEFGILPLLKLLKDGYSYSPNAQIAAVNALFSIATNQQRVRLITEFLGVPIIVKVLGDSVTKVQIKVADLIARMVELDTYAQEEFVTQNVTRPLVLLLSTDLDLDLNSSNSSSNNQPAKTSIHSLVQMKNELDYKKTRMNRVTSLNCYLDTSSSKKNAQHKKDGEMVSPEVEFKLKVSCALALWKLSKGSISNSKKITETKGLLCLAKIIEKETGDLQLNCLMTVMEITAVAETNADLRRAAFKTNWPPAMAILDQLLRVIQEEVNDPVLQIPAIRSIGCLARTFPAKETRIVSSLVDQLGNRNVEVATESAIALGKFVCPENFNCGQHSKAIIEFNGVPCLIKLIRNGGDPAKMQGLVLLCYLSLNVGNSKALEEARALNVLEGAARPVIAQYPELRELFASAIHHLILYQAGAHAHGRPCV
ncbi:uncharacterized protein LOC126675241 [Mercurialis annua]|uniref:uncharacterized protein LOC126675241 n=1 Tax=Mercurialis annua TaxID=3986 RepID=UPI00215DDF05|nr:uncharacterized protein LOC126675241 [Mercurialis annua]